jgi:hypothetical protein
VVTTGRHRRHHSGRQRAVAASSMKPKYSSCNLIDVKPCEGCEYGGLIPSRIRPDGTGRTDSRGRPYIQATTEVTWYCIDMGRKQSRSGPSRQDLDVFMFFQVSCGVAVTT